MDEILKQFYEEDAAYWNLPEDDQVRMFSHWAGSRGLKKELRFAKKRLSRLLDYSLMGGVLICLIFGVIKLPDSGGLFLLVGLILVMISKFLNRKVPVIVTPEKES